MCLLSTWVQPACQWIYPPPFLADGLRNIMCLASAWAMPACQWIYPPPFAADGPRNIMCLLSTWAEPACQWIYPPSFIADGPRKIMCLASAWAEPVMTHSTSVPTPSLHLLGPGPIPDVSSQTRSTSCRVASRDPLPSRASARRAAHRGPCGFSYLPYRPPYCIRMAARGNEDKGQNRLALGGL